MGQSVSNCNGGRDVNSSLANGNTANSNGNKIKSLVSLFSSVFGSKESSKVISNSTLNNNNNRHHNNQRTRRNKPSVVVDVIRSHCLYNGDTNDVNMSEVDEAFNINKKHPVSQVFNCNKFIKPNALVTDTLNTYNLPGTSIPNSLSCYNLKSSKITDDLTIIQSISASIDKVKLPGEPVSESQSTNQYKNILRGLSEMKVDRSIPEEAGEEEEEEEDYDDELERISDYDDRIRPESVALQTVSSPAFIDDEVDETDGDDEDSSIIEEPHEDDEVVHHDDYLSQCETPAQLTDNKYNSNNVTSTCSSVTVSLDSSTSTCKPQQSLPLNKLSNPVSSVNYKNVINHDRDSKLTPANDSIIDTKHKAPLAGNTDAIVPSSVNSSTNSSSLRPFVFLTRSSHTVHPLIPSVAINGILKHQGGSSHLTSILPAPPLPPPPPPSAPSCHLIHEKSHSAGEPVTVQVSPLVNQSHNYVPSGNSSGTLAPVNNRPAVIQASTSDLLRAISCYLEREYVWPLARSGSDALADLVTYSSSDVVLWLRSVDRALLVQGWQDLAFISPSNLVFLFLLLRESLCEINFTSLLHLKCSVLSCLYLAYSYEGNEISYPLKPFLTDGDTRGAFFTRVLSIVSKSSSSMLLMNSDPTFFTSVFTHLLQYSPEHINRSTLVPPSVNIISSHHHHHHQQQQQQQQQQIQYHHSLNGNLKYSGNQTQQSHLTKLQSQVHPQQQQAQQQAQQPHRLILRPLQVISDAKVA